jgi:Rad3-related DNA helicase
MSKEELQHVQRKDKNSGEVKKFKRGEIKQLFTTKCSRGVDFPGDMCRSVVFTKYPNPNVQGTFWKILLKTHPEYYWEFYKDKAQRDFLQRIYRAVRSMDDHVSILSPDSRVLAAVRELQNNSFNY